MFCHLKLIFGNVDLNQEQLKQTTESLNLASNFFTSSVFPVLRPEHILLKMNNLKKTYLRI